MFEGLRKKLSDAVKGFIKKEEQIVEKEEEQQEPEKKEEIEHHQEEQKEKKEEVKHHQEEKQEHKEEHKEAEPKKEEHIKEIHVEKEEKKEHSVSKEHHQEKKKEEIIKLSLTTKIKSAFLGKIKLNENEVNNFLETLKVSMLESDVSYNTTEQFIDDLHSKLREKEINSRRVKEEIVENVRGSLFSILEPTSERIDVDSFVKRRKDSKETPVTILFLGPNGAGKTTTIAKIAHHFKSRGISNVLSASDTFRAAAIEQLEHHAKRIGVPIIKSNYGADPASIAFDAIAYAKAHNIDLVLIDSAGRQETNKSLINEIQKLVRVSKPDITIFVGESTAGNQIAEQIKEFNKFVKINGIILTKLDCDAKGGGAISITHTTGIPILFLGIGEGYDAIIPYDPSYIVNAILPENN
ncbi:MAG: signal recognition particle-docking protein FtsY [Candidatus Micrarchaeaceae archaeon]|jgi:fused signal recognition particle receptor